MLYVVVYYMFHVFFPLNLSYDPQLRHMLFYWLRLPFHVWKMKENCASQAEMPLFFSPNSNFIIILSSFFRHTPDEVIDAIFYLVN